MRTPQRKTVLGSTGSIGMSTMDVVARHPGRFRVFALTAHKRFELLAEQCLQFRPRYAVLLEEAIAPELRQRLDSAGCATDVLCGAAALEGVAADPEVDTVMAAIVGAAGLGPALAAARAGKRVLLANKEPLVMSGQIFIEESQRANAELLPWTASRTRFSSACPTGFAPVRRRPPSGAYS